MPVAYICGPYRAPTIDGVFCNIAKAREAAKLYWKMGYFVFCPHLNSSFMDGVVPDEVFLRADLQFLESMNPESDVVAVLPGWQESVGCLVEHKRAAILGLMIYYIKRLDT